MKKAVFIDKDGTLIKDVPYNVNTNLITFEEGIVPALQQLQTQGYQLIIVSNQPGIAFSYYSEADVQRVYEFLVRELQQHSIQLNGFYFCPHHVQGNSPEYAKPCYCRKPLPGMLLKAAMELDIDLESSWMIGDILNDSEAGNRAGCTTILLNVGNETEWEMEHNRRPNFICNTWCDAAAIISQNANAGVEHV